MSSTASTISEESCSKVYDVLVIGSGPAGTQCALHLKKLGVDVLLAGSEKPSSRIGSMPKEPGWASNRTSDAISRRIAADNAREMEEISPSAFIQAKLSRVTREGRLFRSQAGNRTFLSRAVVLATGSARQTNPDLSEFDLDLDPDGRIEVDDDYQSSGVGVFAIGDLAGGLRTNVSCALGTGARAGRAIWEKFGGRAAARAA